MTGDGESGGGADPESQSQPRKDQNCLNTGMVMQRLWLQGWVDPYAADVF
jgi:hypothetical protein